MKVLIVGCGYAGSLLNYFLFKKGFTVHIADQNEEITSTKVSAGIMLPLTGRRIVKTYNADNIIPFAFKTYRELESISGKSFFKNKDVLQLFTSNGNMNDWFVSSENEGIKKYTGAILTKQEIHPTISNESGGILLKQSGAVDPIAFINAVAHATSNRSVYFKTHVDPNQIHISKSGMTWNGNLYDYIIYCEGHTITKNPWFSYIPFKPAKGEILDFTSQDLDDSYIINSSVFILPEGNGKFRSGSTYNWSDLTTTTTPEAMQTLENGIRNSITCDFKITGHKAGIRPAIIDRRPVIGFHPANNRLGIFNGLGTKGAMLAPYYASQFCDFIAEGKNVDSDVNIRRFDPLFAKP